MPNSDTAWLEYTNELNSPDDGYAEWLNETFDVEEYEAELERQYQELVASGECE